jgi:hypothetical protein
MASRIVLEEIVYTHSLGFSGTLDCDLEPLDFGAILRSKCLFVSRKALSTDSDLSLA